MSRKGENIRRRKDGRWEARCLITEPFTKKKKYIYLYAGSYAEVREKKYRKLAEQHIINQPGTMSYINKDYSIEKLVDCWKESLKLQVKISTYLNYLYIVENRILPEFRGYYTSEITNQWIACFLQKENTYGYAAGTIHLTAVVLRSLLHFGREIKALFSEELHVNFQKKEEAKNRTMKRSDYIKLKDYLSKPKDSTEAGLLLCMFSGIRLGELSGLKWEDIDLKRGTIQIKRTVSRIKNINYTPENGQTKTILYLRTPKTTSSVREIPIPDFLISIIMQYQKNGNCYLMTGKAKCMEPRTIQRKFLKILISLNIPPIKIHALRHQFATNWVEHSFDSKNLSEILGHASVRTTLDIYVHGSLDKKKEYMNQLADKNK